MRAARVGVRAPYIAAPLYPLASLAPPSMHLYVELWKARPAWTALPAAQREAYVAQLGPAIGQLLAGGVELLGFALADADAPYAADYTYLAVWRMPDVDGARALEATVEGAGWHQYFEQVNARGAILPPPAVLTHMAHGHLGDTPAA